MVAIKSIIVGTLLPLAALGTALPQEVRRDIPGPEYNISAATNGSCFDVVVVGGGPSGLSALSGLVRVRRNVLLIDSAEYRNDLTRHVHDVIALDHTPPAAFRAAARHGIGKYPTATMQNGTVTSIVSIDNGTSFLTIDADGNQYTSKKIVLATGLVDLLPSTPGIEEAWSRGIYWCPWCDGYEHRDQRFGILGSIVDVVGSVLEVHNLNTDIIAFVNGTYTPDNEAILDVKRPGWRQQLAGYKVTLLNQSITSIVRTQDGAIVHDDSIDAEYDRFTVNLEDGTTVDRDAFITNFSNKQRSYLGKDVGVPYYNDRMYANQDNMKATTGVWAIGDANLDNSTNVPHAMYTGKRAAVSIHVEIERDFAAGFVNKRSEEDILELMGRDMEDLWDEMRK